MIKILGGVFILKHFYGLLCSVIFVCFSYCIVFSFLSPLFTATEVIIPYGLHPFDICQKNPDLWQLLKTVYRITFIFSYFLLFYLFYLFVIHHFSSWYHRFFPSSSFQDKQTLVENSNELNLVIGSDEKSQKLVVLPESGLYQNFLITGTIGSGKTSSAMYPFTHQFLSYKALHPNDPIGMLILDVKGNYFRQVETYAKKFHLLDDLIVLGISHPVFYNPLHKPNLKPSVLANRIKTVLTLFSENNSESYWLDKAEQILTECVKLCRLYNSGYVTFLELHKLITLPSYFHEKVQVLRDSFLHSRFNQRELYDLNSSLTFFQKEFEQLDTRTKGILISEITRMTNLFISDYDVQSIFCPPKENLTFLSFEEVLEKGKIVVLDMNISQYALLSKMIAAYLKLDFQADVLSSLASNKIHKSIFICDEYDKYSTKTDADFFSISREAKCINIVSTQSYSSLKNTLKDDSTVNVIVQNLINKIWFRTDDIFTIEEAQKQLGKEDKEKVSRSISESAKETNYNYFTHTLNSDHSNISETYSTFMQNDYIFDTNYFTRKLETFSALTFLSDGFHVLEPKKLLMKPYFKN